MLKGTKSKICFSAISDGDLWSYFAKAVAAKGPSSVKCTWVKGHATEQQILTGITTHTHKEGNDAADATADIGVARHGEGMIHLANAYNKRHTRYTEFMFLVVTHIVEAHMIHRELVRIEEAKASKLPATSSSNWTYTPMVYSRSQRIRKIIFTPRSNI